MHQGAKLIPAWRTVSAALLLLSATGASGQEDFICGTEDEPAALAKGADLPRVSTVYKGTSAALMVRIAFKDVPYAVAESSIAKTHAAVNKHYFNMSRNTFQFSFKIHPEVWVAPQNKSYYDSNFTSLRTFITTKIREAGYVKSSTPAEKNYNVFVASFPRINVGWAGLSSGPSSGGNYINGSYGAGVTGHELGHAVGLPHAHAIEPCASGVTCVTTDIFGTPGNTRQHVEYGNPFDVMGSGGSTGHFNVNFKWRTGWMDTEEMLEIKNTGVYRIHASDNSVHKGRLLGIRIPSTDTRYAYWVEYRSTSTGSSSTPVTARTGALIMFEGFNGTNSRGIHLLDLTPQSRTSSDHRDAMLLPGKELKDKYGTVSIKTLGVNTGVWDENGWVDVEVTVPGSAPIAVLQRSRGALRASMGGPLPPAYDLTGRRLERATPWQPVVVPVWGDAASTLIEPE